MNQNNTTVDKMKLAHPAEPAGRSITAGVASIQKLY